MELKKSLNFRKIYKKNKYLKIKKFKKYYLIKIKRKLIVKKKMAGEALWDGWEDPTQTLNKFAWILTLVGGAVEIIFGIMSFITFMLLLNPLGAISTLVTSIIFGGIAIVGAILLIPISKKIKEKDYENVNSVMLFISAIMAAIGVWYFFWAIPHLLIAIFFCILSEYGWPAKGK